MIKKLNYNWIIFSLYALCISLTLTGHIYFGNGLGDLFYLLGMSFVSLVMLIVNIILTLQSDKTKYKKLKLILGVISTLALLYFIYSFTLGRAIEYPWNGNILYK